MRLCYEVVLSWRRGPALAKPIKDLFAERFIAARKKAGLSQEAVAKSLNSTKASVSEWENGRSEPSFTRIAELAKLFGVDPAYFFSEAERTSVSGTATIEESLSAALDVFKHATRKAAIEAAKTLASEAERAVKQAAKGTPQE